MLEKRMKINQETLLKYSLKAVERLKKHPQYKKVNVIGIYHPIKNEMDITSIIEDNKTFLLPKVEGDDMHYYAFNEKSELARSSLNIMEVKEGFPLDSILELVIVPALAITPEGHRIGYGKGFFDRFISKYPHIFTISIVFDFQVIDTIPFNTQDKKVHDIIRIETEDET